MGSFVLKEGTFALKPEDSDSERYWRLRAISSLVLAKLAIEVVSIAPTEAAVERAFTKDGVGPCLDRGSTGFVMFDFLFSPLFSLINGGVVRLASTSE